MADYLVQTDGVSRFTLADGSGFIILAGEPAEASRIQRIEWKNPERRAKWNLSRRIKWRRIK